MKRILALLTLLLYTATACGAQIYNPWSQGFAPNYVSADPGANYLILSPYTVPLTGQLTNYRFFAPQSPLTFTDNGAAGQYQLSLNTVPISKGGTNGITGQAGFNNLAGVTAGAALATGDILYYNGTNWARLAAGTNGNFLTQTAGVPAWAASPTGAPSSAQYVTLAVDGGLSAERVLTGTANRIVITDGGANGNVTLDVGTDVVTLTGSQVLTNKTFGSTMTLNNALRTAGVSLNGAGAFSGSLRWADFTGNWTLTIPDPGASASFVMTEGAQTVNGTKTMSGLKLGADTITSSTGNTITFPNAADTVVNLASSQTLSSKTLTSAQISNANPAITWLQSAGNYIINAANPAATRTYSWYDANGNGDIAIKSGTPTAGTVAYADGNLIKFTGTGTAGQALLSNAGSPPAYGNLGAATGGTGTTTVPAKGSILVGNAGGTAYANLPVGTDTFVLTADAASTNGVKWAAAGGGAVTVNSATTNDLAWYSGNSAISGGRAVTTPSAGTLQSGTAGTTAGTVSIMSATASSGTTQLQHSPAAGTGVTNTYQLPGQAANSTQQMVPFGGNGSDGAVTIGANTTTETRVYNATTYQVSSTFFHNCGGCIINTSSTLTVSGTLRSFTTGVQTSPIGGGGAGGLGAAAASNAGGNGYGWAPGFGGASGALTAAGGGAGAAAQGGTGGGNPGGAGAGAPGMNCGGNSHFGSSLRGSGGGGGGTGSSGTQGGNGGAGGNVITLISAGGLVGTGTIRVGGGGGNGGAGTIFGGGGGGGGGTVEIFNGSGNLPGLTIDASGGAGGTGGSTAANTGGGGGGYICGTLAGTTGTITTSVAGGAAGTGGAGTAGGAGGTGLVNLIQNTLPTLPNISFNRVNDNFAGKTMCWILLARKHLQGLDCESEAAHTFIWDGEKNEHRAPLEYTAAFFAKPGCFDAVYTALLFGGDDSTANMCDASVAPLVKESFATFKDAPFKGSMPLVESTCDDTELLRPSV